jgi:Ceramidase
MLACESLYSNLGKPTIQFAENNLSGCIAQPANTFSNIAYIIIAIMAAFVLAKTKSKLLYLFPFVYVLIGFTSGFYHASATFVGQFFDFFSIYMLGSVLIYFAAKRSLNISTKLLTFILIFLTFGLGFVLWYAPFLRIFIAFGELFLLLYLEYKNRKLYHTTYTHFATALRVFLVAFGIWMLDETMIWDIDWLEHYINGHAIWHILTAVSLWFVFKHYLESEAGQNKHDLIDKI